MSRVHDNLKLYADMLGPIHYNSMKTNIEFVECIVLSYLQKYPFLRELRILWTIPYVIEELPYFSPFLFNFLFFYFNFSKIFKADSLRSIDGEGGNVT